MRFTVDDFLERVQRAKDLRYSLSIGVPHAMVMSASGWEAEDFARRYAEKALGMPWEEIERRRLFLALSLPWERPASEMARFLASPDIYARVTYRNHFEGVLYISLDELGGNYEKEEAFARFVEYVDGNLDRIRFVFRVPDDPAAAERLYLFFQERMDIDLVAAPADTMEREMLIFIACIRELGISPDADTKKILERYIGRIRGKYARWDPCTLEIYGKRIRRELLLEGFTAGTGIPAEKLEEICERIVPCGRTKPAGMGFKVG